MEEEQNLGEKLVKKGIWLYVFPLLSAPLLYINRIIISNDLSVSDIGIFYSVIGFFLILSMYNDLGFTEALNYYLPKYREEKNHDQAKTTIYISFILQIISCVLISSAVYFFSDYLAINYFGARYAVNIIKIFIIYFFFLNFFQTLQTIFLVVQDTFWSKMLDFIQTSLLFLFVIAIWKFGISGKILYYSLAWGISMFLAITLGFFVIIKKYLKKINQGKFRFIKKDYFEVQKYAIWTLVRVNIGTLMGSLDQQFAIFFLGPEKSGFYTNSVLFFNLFGVFAGPFMAFMFPLTSELFAKKQIKKIEFLVNFLQKYLGILSLGVSVFFFVFAQVLVVIFLGDKFLESANILRRSIVFLYFYYSILLYFNFLSGMGKIKERVKIVSVGLISNVVLSLSLIHFLGIYGIALSNGLTFLILFIITLFYFKKFGISIKFDFKFFFKNLVFLLLSGIVLYFFVLGYFNLGGSRMSLIIKLAAVFLVCVVLRGIININDIKMFLGEIKKIAKNSK